LTSPACSRGPDEGPDPSWTNRAWTSQGPGPHRGQSAFGLRSTVRRESYPAESREGCLPAASVAQHPGFSAVRHFPSEEPRRDAACRRPGEAWSEDWLPDSSGAAAANRRSVAESLLHRAAPGPFPHRGVVTHSVVPGRWALQAQPHPAGDPKERRLRVSGLKGREPVQRERVQERARRDRHPLDSPRGDCPHLLTSSADLASTPSTRTQAMRPLSSFV